MKTVKLTLKPYLAEYLQKKYPAAESGLVKIPPASELYDLLLSSMRCDQKEPADDWNVEIILPNPSPSSGCRRSRRHYGLSSAARSRIARAVYVMYWSDCHRYIERRIHVYGDLIIDAASQFVNEYGLMRSNEDAILKNYQRWRARRLARRHLLKNFNSV